MTTNTNGETLQVHRFITRFTVQMLGSTCLLCFPGVALPMRSQLPSVPPPRPMVIDASLEHARSLIKNGKYQEANDLLLGVAVEIPGKAEVHSLLGLSYLRLDKPAESLHEYTLEGALQTPSPADLQNVAKDYVLLKDDTTAEHWAQVAVQMDDRNAESWYVLGRIRYTLQRFQEAANCFERSLVLAPRSTKAANNLGLSFEGLNRVEDAVTAYRDAIAWQQNSSEPSEQPLLNLGIVLAHQGKFDEASGLLKQAAAMAPNDPQIHQELGQLFLSQGRLADAQQQLEIAVRLDPDKGALHFLLGKVYHQEGHADLAESEFSKTRALLSHHGPSKL